MVVEKLSKGGGKYEVLRRKFELDYKDGLVGKLKNKIKERNEKDWEEAYMKNTLKWYRLAKNDSGWRDM